MELVAFLGDDNKNWGQVTALINRLDDCDKFILIKSKSSPEFPLTSKCKLIEVDTTQPLTDLKEKIQEKLKPELSSSFEVALSIASGTGKEHMAIISALLNIPVGIKMVVYTKDGIQFLT